MAVYGHTGTREGMSQLQAQGLFEQMRAAILEAEVEDLGRPDWHHGCCAGSDQQGSVLAAVLGFYIIGHPGYDGSHIKYCFYDKLWQPTDNIQRDDDIGLCVETLFATPKEDHEVRRSGTWTTVRHAKRKGKDVIIIWRDGTWELYTGGQFRKST